ncbi:hypothetical protein KPH14_004316 [Odynerus spinipes]|uniref:Uncharacterized protein n=1 Tax=Odynerus spinipes TaxID=1348599 RepID=A0AAD9RYH7_9HYME|nr:hypothetical protein KPH14_004316 [Odynerus spinipes]
MFEPIRFFVIVSVLQVIVLGDLSKIDNVQACMDYCSTSGSIGCFKDGQCTCENVDNKDAENVFRESRQVEYFEPSLYSKDLTDEERTARCTLGSRKRLRTHDADRVVKYFVNDGPSSGHAYFVGATNSNDDVEKECKSENESSSKFNRNVDESNNPVPDQQGLELVEDNYYQPSYSDAFVGAPYNPYNPVYFVPHEVPIAPIAMNPYEHVMDGTYGSAFGSRNHILTQPISTMYPTPRDRLLGAKLPRRTVRPRLNALKHFSNALLGLVREPVNEGLLGAHSLLHNLVKADPIAYSPNYVNDLSTVGISNAESIVADVNPIVGIKNENAQTPKANPESTPEDNAQESSETKKSTNSVPSIQRANKPTEIIQNIPYNQQYFIPMYHPYKNPTGAMSNSIPRAYFLQPVRIMPQATRSAPSSQAVNVSQPRDSSNCEHNNSSNNEDNSMDSANTTTEKPKEETSSDSSREKTLKDTSKIK